MGQLYSGEDRLEAQRRLAREIFKSLDDSGRLALADELDDPSPCPWYQNSCAGTRLLLTGQLLGWQLANLIVSAVLEAATPDGGERASVG